MIRTLSIKMRANDLAILLSLIVVVKLVYVTDGFNLSPNPNLVLMYPPVNTFQPQVRSSYFGYSINLRKNSILVGAPRAQSTIEKQRNVNETGAIFKCPLDANKPCYPYNFDLYGNVRVENTEIAYNSEKKDYQMLGAAMDGHGSESDRFVVCGPKLKADLEESLHYLLHGICYWVSETNSDKPNNVRKITPLRQRDMQIFPDRGLNHYYYMYGESGFSVHVTDNNEEIIIGAPGIFNWKGSIIRYRAFEKPDLGGLSRRASSDRKVIRRRQLPNIFEYRSEIPNPYYSDVSDDSYFGYAVNSGLFLGYDNPRIYYVASAPQSNLQTGEVFIFDISDYQLQKRIKTYNKFSGSQMGEYFGYSLLVDDFNGDDLPDLAVGAPFYSKTGDYENGGVYIYMNTGSLNFEKQPMITSDFEFSGRFGISLGKIGDVNYDGYSDLAVSAPFENDGVVYIFLGGPNGLSKKPSQVLKAPKIDIHKYGTAMFGHGISRGVDIDNNGHNDIAIGAPNLETVYVYKSYPVIKVISSISSTKNELTMEDNGFQINVCLYYESRTNVEQEHDLSLQLGVDMQHNRASFSPKEPKKVINITKKINNQPHCWEYDVYVKSSLADIFKPINIEVKYDLISKVPQDVSEFCESCVTIDPNDPKLINYKVAFSTGCAGERCISDLVVKGTLVNIRQPYVIGSTKTIAIQYEIYNAGETAYLGQIGISIPKNITQFAKIPSNCKLVDDTMTCDIEGGKPLANKEKSLLLVSLDATKLEGDQFTVRANATSAGDESNPEDNYVENVIYLTEFSEIEVFGLSSKHQLSIEDGLRVENITFTYEIRNNGPSHVKELNIGIMIPISYILEPRYEHNVVKFESVVVKGFYSNKALDVTWARDNKILLKDAYETSSMRVVDNMNGFHFDSSKTGFDYEFNSGVDSNQGQAIMNHRKRRSLFEDDFEDMPYRHYNAYTNSIEEYEASVRSLPNEDDHTLRNLPKNNTVYMNCLDLAENDCIEAQFVIQNFKPGNTPVEVSISFSLDLERVDRLFSDVKNIFLYQTRTKIQRSGDEEMNSIKVTARNPYVIVYEHLTSETPVFVIVIAAFCGVLLLILLSFLLYKCGFFKRAKKEELEKLTRESKNLSAEMGEELKNLNTPH